MSSAAGNEVQIVGAATLKERETNVSLVIEVFKYMHRICNIDCTQILPCHQAVGLVTRGQSRPVKLQKRDCTFEGECAGIQNSESMELIIPADSGKCFKGRSIDRLSGSKRFCEQIEEVLRTSL